MGVCHDFSAGYTSIAQGRIERLLQTLASALRSMVQKRKSRWADYVQSVVFAYNNLPIGDTDLTPFLLLYGRMPRFPTDLSPVLATNALRSRSAVLGTILENQRQLYEIRDEYTKEYQKSRLKYINMHKKDSTSFQVGCMVFMKQPPNVGVTDAVSRFKFERTFIGPYLVSELLNDNTVILKNMETQQFTRPVHMTKLKYHEYFDINMYLALTEIQ
jgi:hypothetical protein